MMFTLFSCLERALFTDILNHLTIKQSLSAKMVETNGQTLLAKQE